MARRWQEIDLEFEASLLEDLLLEKSIDEIDLKRSRKYSLGSYEWALWCMEKGEGYEL